MYLKTMLLTSDELIIQNNKCDHFHSKFLIKDDVSGTTNQFKLQFKNICAENKICFSYGHVPLANQHCI